MQVYGGSFFTENQEKAEKVFMDTTPPTPSRKNVYSYGNSGSVSYQQPVNMSNYYNSGGSCYDGNGVVQCPALKWDGERHICHLCTLPGEMGFQYRMELYVGAGCCSNLNSWRRSKLEDRTLSNKKGGISNPIPTEFQILLRNLGKEMISPDALYLTVEATKRNLMDNGWSESRVDTWGSLIMHHIKQSRPSFIEDFMG